MGGCVYEDVAQNIEENHKLTDLFTDFARNNAKFVNLK